MTTDPSPETAGDIARMPAVLAGAVIAKVMRAAAGAGMRGALPCLRAAAAVPPAVAAPVRAEPLVSFLRRLDDRGAAGAAVLDAVPACRDSVPAAERLDRPDGQAGGGADFRIAFPFMPQTPDGDPLGSCHRAPSIAMRNKDKKFTLLFPLTVCLHKINMG